MPDATTLRAPRHADTLVDNARTLPTPARAEFSDAPTLPATQGLRDGGPRVTAPTRTTVLPRISLEGGAPQLIVDGRDRFEEVSVLGRGGMGEVLLALDHDIERRVALKRLLPESEGTSAVARFADEVRVLGALDHPNIVPVHDVGVTPDGKYFYVMKYIEGETLERIIERLAAGDPEYHHKYSFERRIEVFTSVLRAVQYAHAQGYVHRDLKPANIMVGRYGEVVVMDWGIARRIHDTVAPAVTPDAPRPSTPATGAGARLQTQEGSLLGTPAYMSPEQSRGELDLVDERSDVYALGVICHELMTLRHYLSAHESVTATLLAVSTENPPLASYERHPAQGPVPAHYAHFIRHCMDKSRETRFRSVTAMLDRLAEIAEGRFPVECPVTFMKRATCAVQHGIDRSPRNAMLAGMGALGLSLGGLIGIVTILLRG